MVNNSFNFRKTYGRADLINFISSNQEKSGQILRYNLTELGNLKKKSNLWFDIDKGKIHIDTSNILVRQFTRLFSIEKGFNQKQYLRAFKVFAEVYFSLYQPDLESLEEITNDLEKAKIGLRFIEGKNNPSVAKLENLFDKLIVDIHKRAEIQQAAPLDFLKTRGKYWKKISNWKTSKKETKEEVLKEAYLSSKFLLQSNSRYDAVINELEKKNANLHQLFQGLLQVAPRPQSINFKEFSHSLLAEFLLSVDKESELKNLIQKLSKYEKLPKAGHSEKEIKKLKQVAIWKSGLFRYTPGAIPKDRASKEIIPPAVRARAIVKGINKVIAGGLTVTIGILFPPLLLFAGVGIRLAKDGVELILNKKDSLLNPEQILDDIIKFEKKGKNVKTVKTLGEGIVSFAKDNL